VNSDKVNYLLERLISIADILIQWDMTNIAVSELNIKELPG
jgi:hypothetical protein